MDENITSIPQLLVRISEEICDNYCKWPEKYTDDTIFEEKCNDCPLTKYL